VFLVLLGLPGVVMPNAVSAAARKFPRSLVLGIALLTVAFVWSLWLLWTMEMGEFSSFRRPLLIILPIGFLLVLRFVNEFLAVRALGILFLLAAEPLLESAFLRYEQSRLVVTVLAYILILLGLFWVSLPYLLRDQIGWASRTATRWLSVSLLALIYGAVLLFFAFSRY
jgi:hypothetical protein